MKKIISMLMIFVLCLCVTTGCKLNKKNDKISIVCTIFPEYDWVREIVGDLPEYEVTLLLDNGIDLHNYQPTAADIAKIAACDVFIYVGGESDEWTKDALKEAINKDMKVINLMDVLGDKAKVEEIKEGMQEEEHEEDMEDEEETEYDEHVWLSIANAKILSSEIADIIADIDDNNKETIKNNLNNYLDSLSAVDSKYKEAVKNAENKVIVCGDRFPFRYLVDDYNLDYYAAFVGCSADSKASFETVTFLSGKLDSLKLKNIIVTESSDKKLAETIIKNTKNKNQKILVLDSMQSITGKDVKAGTTYISVMEKNLEVLKTALE